MPMPMPMPMPNLSAMREPRFTVLGGRGFIGSHLVRHLRRQGHEVWVPERDDPALFERELGQVVYAIGLTADFRRRPLDTVQAHVGVLRRVIDAARFDSLTYLSSTRVYAGAAGTSEAAALRVDPNAPGDLYNLSKLLGEALCLHCGHTGMKVVRLANIVGAPPATGPDSGAANFIDALIDAGRRTGQVRLQTSLASSKDYLGIDAAADLLARIALASDTGIFNLASGCNVSNAEIKRLIELETGWDVSVAPDAPTWGFAPIDVSRVTRRFALPPRALAGSFTTSFTALLRAAITATATATATAPSAITAPSHLEGTAA